MAIAFKPRYQVLVALMHIEIFIIGASFRFLVGGISVADGNIHC
jgi:hypothetical protein